MAPESSEETFTRPSSRGYVALAFIQASLVWFTAGIALGLAMAIQPQWVVYRPAHAHLNVVGFLTMMVFGVGYQLLPRLFGHAIHSRGLAIAHWWLANLGMAALVTGFLLAPHYGPRSAPLTATGGALFSLGACCFIYNLGRTFDSAEARQRERRAGKPPGPALPTLGE